MGSLDVAEAQLKKKLEETDNIEERREIRKQLRELRNKKFEEEIKKVTATDYRPGRDRTALSNGVDSSIKSISRTESVSKNEEEDKYGIYHIETEEELQALLNETPFTETDKRKKIRARIRDIRNHKLGLGDPVVIKQTSRVDRASSVNTEKEENKKTAPAEQEPKKADSLERETSSSYSRSSYRSRYTDDVSTAEASRSRRNYDSAEGDSSYRSTRSKKYAEENGPSSKVNEEVQAKEKDVGLISRKSDDAITEENVINKDEDNEDQTDDVGSDADEGVDENEADEEVVENEADEGVVGNDADEEVIENDSGEEESHDSEDRGIKVDNEAGEEGNVGERGRASSDEAEIDDSDSEKEDIGDKLDEEEVDEEKDEDNDYYNDYGNDEVNVQEEIDREGEQNYSKVEDEEEIDREGEQNYSKVEDEERYEDEREDVVDAIENEKSGELDRDCSAEDEDQYSEEEIREERVTKDDESLDEEDYSDDEDGDYEGEDDEKEDDRIQESKEVRMEQEYSDDYSEGYSDQTQTDEGSSVGGRRFDDDQNLDGYEVEKSPGSRLRSGSSGYARKVEEAFKQKEPALAEGKNFKELLKRSDKNTPGSQLGSGKKGPEQVDFRTVLRSADKPKKLGDKSTPSVEQIDFRNLLQKKVKTKTLADKDINAEQVDFRTVLKGGAAEKKDSLPRKTSAAEQLDFRNVLKKQPSVKSRKLSTDDKNEMIRNIRAGNKNLEIAAAKPGRPSLDSLRQGGAVTKAKGELSKNRTESTSSETEKSERKASRPSLDALKESGELGKTKDKKGVFEEGKKAAAAVPPKPLVKKKSNKSVVEKIENEIIEEPQRVNDVENQPEVVPDFKKPSPVDNRVESSRQSAGKSNDASATDTAERPRGRRRKEEDASKERPRSDRISSQEGDDKRSSLKSGDKRARLRRLRQDQNDVVKEVTKKSEKDDADDATDIADTKSKSSSIERVAVVQNTASRPTVQVILSTKSSAEKDKQEDSDDESIGVRRNRRRVLRKSSVDEKETSRVDVKTVTSANSTVVVNKDRKSRRGSSTGSSNADEADSKPARSAPKRETGTPSKVSTNNEKTPETGDDPAKARKAKMASLDAKMAERRRQRALESKEKQQKIRNNRKAFKDQLDSSAPTTNGSASPSVQRANSNMTKLLHWCQKMTDGYPNVAVTNFTTSWNDGLAFCALLHNFTPEKIPFGELSPKRPRENFELAFSAATDEGVPELLEVEDMVRMESPDPKSVITYLHSIYQVFVADRR